MEQAYTQLRNQKLTELFRNDYNALISEAAARGDMGEVELYQNLRAQKLFLYANSDFTALAREALANGDQELADIYTALHNEKRAFLEGNDLEALAQEAEKLGNSELAAIYRQLREQKIQNGYGTVAGGAGTGGDTGTTPGGKRLRPPPSKPITSYPLSFCFLRFFRTDPYLSKQHDMSCWDSAMIEAEKAAAVESVLSLPADGQRDFPPMVSLYRMIGENAGITRKGKTFAICLENNATKVIPRLHRQRIPLPFFDGRTISHRNAA